MIEVVAFEGENTLASLLDRVEEGDELVITREGRAVARLIPNAAEVDREQARAALERIRQRAGQLGRREFDWQSLKTDRDAGRA